MLVNKDPEKVDESKCNWKTSDKEDSKPKRSKVIDKNNNKTGQDKKILYKIRSTPPIFRDPDQLEYKINKYFNDCYEEGCRITITGLSLALGFKSKEDLLEFREDPINYYNNILYNIEDYKDKESIVSNDYYNERRRNDKKKKNTTVKIEDYKYEEDDRIEKNIYKEQYNIIDKEECIKEQEKNKKKYIYLITMGLSYVEHQYEINLQRSGGSQVGSIFALKNLGWVDVWGMGSNKRKNQTADGPSIVKFLDQEKPRNVVPIRKAM